MKKTYIAPQSMAVTLFTEEALLSASKVLNVDENKSINGDAVSYTHLTLPTNREV